jgi:hypothetical protein
MSKTTKEVLVTAGKGKSRKQKGGGAKKIGRSKIRCGKYKSAGIREKNKKKHIAKDLKLKLKKKTEKGG